MLERALIQSGARCGVAVAIAGSVQRKWASATFTGTRHVLSLKLGKWEDACGWLMALPDANLPLRGHLVADLGVIEIERGTDQTGAIVEVLTVEER